MRTRPALFRAVALAIALVLGSVLALWWRPSADVGLRAREADAAAATREEPARVGASPATSTPNGGRPFPRAMHDAARRDELRARLLAALAAPPPDAAASAGEDDDREAARRTSARGQRDTNDLEEFGRFIAQAIREDFLPMARECAKDLAARQPDAGGYARVAFELLGDSKIGGVVNSAEVVPAESSVHDAAFETCVRESLYGVYFDPPPAGGRATLNFDVRLGDAGALDEQVDDFHLKDKR